MEVLRTQLSEWQPVGIDAISIAPAQVDGIEVPEPRLVVGRANGTVELWDTSTWHLRLSSTGCSDRSFRGFVWIPSSQTDSPVRLLSAGLNREITEWNLNTLHPQVSVASGGGAIWALCVAANRLLVACDDGSIRVFSPGEEAQEIVYERKLVVGKLRLLSLTALGSDSIFAGGCESQISKWSLSSGGCVARMTMEKGKTSETLVWSLARLGTSALASGDSLGLVTIWDAGTCTMLQRLSVHQADVLSLAASADGRTLLSAGIDRKVSEFAWQSDAANKWSFIDGDLSHTHDVRALYLDPTADERASPNTYVSGGVSGELIVKRLMNAGTRKHKNETAFWTPCSSLSPMLQTASVAEDSRLVLCQRDAHLELWYLQPPKEHAPSGVSIVPVGSVQVPAGRLPEAQLVLRIALNSKPEGQHLSASAITPNGQLIAASDLSGTRLFHLNIEDLEVRRESGLPNEVKNTAARSLLFCGVGLLAIAAWHTCEVLIVDISRSAVVARFKEHKVPISHLASACEWLASADTAGVIHIFNLDSCQHHARVPSGGGKGFPTALGFDAKRKRLIVTTSDHHVLMYDIEAQAFSAELPHPAKVPFEVLPLTSRICGVAAFPGKPNKVLLWGHTFLLALDLNPSSSGNKLKGSRETSEPGWDKTLPPKKGLAWSVKEVPHVLALWALDEAHWGSAVLKNHAFELDADGQPGKPPAKRRRVGMETMVLTIEVSPDAAKKALPKDFERKEYKREKKVLS